MTGDNTINVLLEAFQECRRRGDWATLFLETKNGNEFATLKVKMPASHTSTKLGNTFHGSAAKRKSPSAVRRDRERMEKFVVGKRLQETWPPEKSSTPSIKLQFQERNIPSVDNKQTTVSESPEPVIDKPETLEPRQEDEKVKECEMSNLEDHETNANDKLDKKNGKGLSEEDFNKLLEKFDKILDTKKDEEKKEEEKKDEEKEKVHFQFLKTKNIGRIINDRLYF